jgi:hypothetical protein
MAPAAIYPKILVVLAMIHHLQHVNDAVSIIYSPDQPEAVIAYVEHHAIPNLIGRSECLPEFSDVAPFGVFGQLVPGGQVPFGN